MILANILDRNKQFIYKSTNCISPLTLWFKIFKQGRLVNECLFQLDKF